MTPDEYTIEEKHIDVGNGHELYTQLYGSKSAKQTILLLHGGPGSGSKDGDKKFFDPKKQRALFIDQRGSGNSTPTGSIENNTTNDLVEDIVKVAKEYDIDKLVMTGGSWGSTLALVFAIQHPEMVEALVVRGVFTARRSEIDFLDKGGMKAFFPDIWEEYTLTAPKEHRNDPSSYHGPRILGNDPVAAKESAYAYSNLEHGVMRLDDRVSVEDFKEYDKSSSTIEYYYLANNCFLDEGYIMDNAQNISCPVHIVQGRYDAVCPPYTAYELEKKLPTSSIHWTLAGHSGGERSNWEVTKALLAAITT